MIKSKEEIKKSFLLICITSNLQKDEGNHPTIKCPYIYYTISKLSKTIEQVKKIAKKLTICYNEYVKETCIK